MHARCNGTVLQKSVPEEYQWHMIDFMLKEDYKYIIFVFYYDFLLHEHYFEYLLLLLLLVMSVMMTIMSIWWPPLVLDYHHHFQVVVFSLVLFLHIHLVLDTLY